MRSGFAGSAMAADGDISLCAHPQWGQAYGYDRLLVSGADNAMLEKYSGVSCEMMGRDLASAQSLACTRLLTNNGQKWGVYNGASDSAGPLTCG